MNKTFKLYGIIFIIVLVVLALLEFNKTQITDWRKNFDVNEKTPFGLFVFNKEIGTLLHQKVKKENLSPFDFYQKNTLKPHNILVIESEIDEESWNKILKNVEKGSDALIISDFFHSKISDSLKFYNAYGNYEDQSIYKLTDEKFKSDSIVLDKLPTGKSFSSVSKNHLILGAETSENKYANFLKINHGKGHLFLHTEPLILTNYYLLKPGNERYVQDVFSYLPERETIWFSGNNQKKSVSTSPMRFILSQPALKYSWWLLLGGLLLFVFFNAKRKQRIVPIIEPLPNKSVEFVKSIGNLYLQEGDFHDMMAKKAQYFLNRVRMDLLIDTNSLDEKFQEKLHLKTGISKDKIAEATKLLLDAQNPYSSVIKDDLVRMNNLLDQILK